MVPAMADRTTERVLTGPAAFTQGGPDSFKTWFLSIVANECRMARRGRWWHVIRVREPPRQPGSVEDLAAAGDLRAAISKLGATDQAAPFCYFYLDLPMDR